MGSYLETFGHLVLQFEEEGSVLQALLHLQPLARNRIITQVMKI